jgi:peptidylprolyl isomerase
VKILKLKSKIVIIITLTLGLQLGFSNLIFQVQASGDVSDELIVILQTSMGNITIQLKEDMPITVGNFKNLLDQGVYDNIIFHRVIDGFMIQGGDPTGTGFGDPSIPYIKDEFTDDNRNDRGTIAMANKGFSNSGSSQFFINLVNNNYLDDKHPVFGKVIEGMDVVDAIAKVATDANDKPIEDVTIINAQVIPEFPSWIVLPLFLIVTIIALVVRRRVNRNTKCL